MSFCHMLQVIAQRDAWSSFQGSFYHCLIISWSDTAPLHSIWETLPFWVMMSLRWDAFRSIREVNCLFLSREGRSKSHKAVKEVTLAGAVRFSTIPMIPMSWFYLAFIEWHDNTDHTHPCSHCYFVGSLLRSQSISMVSNGLFWRT